MSNMSVIQLDGFPGANSSTTTTKTIPLRLPPVKLDNEDVAEKKGKKKKAASPFYPSVIPQLYATPKSTQLPDSESLSSFAPSPYVVNHKRRGPRLVKGFSQDDVVVTGRVNPPPLPSKSFSQVDLVGAGSDLQEEEDCVVPPPPAAAAANGYLDGVVEDEKIDDIDTSSTGKMVTDEKDPLVVGTEVEPTSADFFDPRESMSVASSSAGMESGNGPERISKPPSTPLGEFYDAFEEISNEAITPSALQNMETEFREMRLNLLIEIEKRKQAEESVRNLESEWQCLSHQLSLVGFTLPSMSTIIAGDHRCLDKNTDEELQQQVIILRLVSGSIGRGCTRAEVEQVMESHIEIKNFEIARLWDRLQYYEAANREMSQRNQEAVERTRQQRIRRKRRQKWIWTSFGLAIAMGAAAVTWSYLLPISTADSRPTETNGADSHE